MAHVELSGLSKQFDELLAVNDISLQIERGEFFTIVGPSGCGKSTTLRMIAGFEQPTQGRITIDGIDVTELEPNERDVGLVFQSYALFPHMTAAENVGFGLRMHDVPKTKRQQRIEEVLSLVDLPHVGDQYPSELSGGQQQRVALARALVIEPDVLLLDEPLSNLDQQLRDELQTELKRIQDETGVTTVHVTHDQEEALTLADRMCVLRDGQIEQVAPPETVYNGPKTRFVANFIGQTNMLEVRVVSEGDQPQFVVDSAPELRLPLPSPRSSTATEGTVVVRPGDLTLRSAPTQNDSSGTQIDATIDSKQFRGEFMRYQLTATTSNGQSIGLIVHAKEGHAIGDTVSLYIPHDSIIFYPAVPEEVETIKTTQTYETN